MLNNKNSFKEIMRQNGFYILTGVTLIAVVITAVALPKKGDIDPEDTKKNYSISQAQSPVDINDLRVPTIETDIEDDNLDSEEEGSPTFSQESDVEESASVSDNTSDEELVSETFSTTTVEDTQLFHPDDELFAWPMESEIIYKYSDDNEGSSFMNPTLDRTMRSFGLMLKADENSKVKAAAKGKVVLVGEYPDVNVSASPDYPRVGTAVVIDHGNEWQSVYGLHKGESLVSVGDIVDAGEEIGKVGLPSKDFILTGNNLYFQILKDKVPVNPESKLNK